MKELFGACARAIYTNEDQSSLFVLISYPDNGVLEFPLYADCCSESWYADITGVDALIGKEVTGIERLDLPEPNDGRSRQESDEAYGYRLKTQRGYVDIVFRNSSNGYYGGSMLPTIKHEKLPDGLFKITGDWRAEDMATLPNAATEPEGK